jgi:hypothetical protein
MGTCVFVSVGINAFDSDDFGVDGADVGAAAPAAAGGVNAVSDASNKR